MTPGDSIEVAFMVRHRVFIKVIMKIIMITF